MQCLLRGPDRLGYKGSFFSLPNHEACIAWKLWDKDDVYIINKVRNLTMSQIKQDVASLFIIGQNALNLPFVKWPSGATNVIPKLSPFV